MALVVNTNVGSLNAQRQLNSTTNEMSTAMERLSSGKRINTAADDAAGLTIATRMTSQIKGLNMAIRNANDGISLAQTAEGAMEEVTSMLQRMRELSVQASSSLNNDSDRSALNDEVQQLKAEIERVATTTKFNNKSILDGSLNSTIQIGDQVSQTMSLSVGSIQTANMGETATGAASDATFASLAFQEASAEASAYHGKSFNVAVNGGAAEVVSLAAATPVVATPASSATITGTLQGVDAGPAVRTASSSQLGAIADRTVDLSAANNRILNLQVNGGPVEAVDITTRLNAISGINTSAVTQAQFLTALNQSLDDNASFSGANAVTASVNSDGRVVLALDSGSAGTIALTRKTAPSGATLADGLLVALGGNHQGESSSTGSLEIGGAARTYNFTDAAADASSGSGTKFGVGVHDITPDTGEGDQATTQYSEKGNGVDIGSELASGGTASLDAGDEAYFDLESAITALGYNATALTGEQFAAAMNHALDNQQTAKYAAVTASYDSTSGRVTIAGLTDHVTQLMDGDSGDMLDILNAGGSIITESDSHSGGVDKIIITAFEFPSETFGKTDITVGAGTLDLSAGADDTKFVVYDVTNTTEYTIDIASQITAAGYDESALTTDQLAEVMQTAINASALSGAVVAADGDGNITVDLADGAAVWQLTDDADADLLKVLGLNTQGEAVTGNTNKIVLETGVVNSNSLTLGVNGGNTATLSIASATYDSWDTLASAVQTAIDDSNLFAGDYAVSVTATTDADGNNGLTFSNAAGKEMSLSGTFVTDVLGIQSDGANNDEANVGTHLVDANNNVTITAASHTPQAGANHERTVSLSAAANRTFRLDVNGTGVVDIDLGDAATSTSALARAGVTANNKVTGEQLVDAINLAIDDIGHFQGDNDVTAALDANGDLTLTVAGGARTLSVTETGTGLVSVLTNVSGVSAETSKTADLGIATIKNTAPTSEVFGEFDIVVTDGTNDTLTVTVGSNAAVNLDIAAASYDNMAAYVAAIQAAADANASFTGSNALTVTEQTDTNGAKGYSIASATGEAVTVSGTAITVNTLLSSGATAASTAGQSANVNFGGGNGGATPATGATSITFPAAQATVGGIDLSSDNLVTVTVTDNETNAVTSRQVTLGSSSANESFANFATLLQTAMNDSFSADGYSFSASAVSGNLSVALDQTGNKSVTLSGTSITDALGQAASATGSDEVVSSDGVTFESMQDVVAAINSDLTNATASYDAVNGLKFTAATGSAGASSSIELSGSDLSSVNVSGGLTATGADSDATGSRIADISVSSTADASVAITSIDNAIEYVNSQRAGLGAAQNRLQHTVNNLSNVVENTSASRSRIEDADFATEAANLAKAQVLQQAGTAMLAQANAQGQIVLSLLG